MASDLKKTLEALLFSTAEPISLKDFVKIFTRFYEERASAGGEDGNVDEETADNADNGDDEAEEGAPAGSSALPAPPTKAEIQEALLSLMEEAEAEDKAYRIAEGPNGYQLVTNPRFSDFVRLLRGEPRPAKLSPAALETLAIVAYRQPVTRAEMEAIRGVSADSALNKLIERELVFVTGRAELPGRPIQYGTTDKFLEFAGIRSLDALPASDVLDQREIDDWMRQGESAEAENISDQDVGLAPERKPDELPLDETFVEVSWTRENTESDAAGRHAPEPEEDREAPRNE
ncbi:MAG: SMC-Scp complex subunit ScpB [Opitutales bacterium]